MLNRIIVGCYLHVALIQMLISLNVLLIRPSNYQVHGASDKRQNTSENNIMYLKHVAVYFMAWSAAPWQT